MKHYNFEQARDEASKLEEKIINREAEDYSEAEQLVEGDIQKKFDSLDYKNFDIKSLKAIPPMFHKKVALKLIESGEDYLVAKKLKEFSELDREVAEKLIEKGNPYEILFEPEKFSGLVFDKALAMKVIRSGNAELIFKGIGHERVNRFENLILDREIAIECIKQEEYYPIDHPEKFSDFSLDRDIALLVIEHEYIPGSIIKLLKKFKNLNFDNDLAVAFAGKIQYEDDCYYLKKFQGLDSRVAIKLAENHLGKFVLEEFELFQGLNKEVAYKLIERGYGWGVLRGREKFNDFKIDQNLAVKLIAADEKEFGREIFHKENIYGVVFDNEFALQLISVGKENTISKHLYIFNNLGKDVALKLIEKGFAQSLDSWFESFYNLDQEVAIKMIEAGRGYAIMKNWDKFSGLDKKTIAFKYIENGKPEWVDLKFFNEIDHNEIVLKIIEAGKANYYNGTNSLDKYEGLNQETAIKLIEAGVGDTVLINLRKDDKVFNNINYSEIAYKLIEIGKSELLAINLFRLQGLDRAIAWRLIEANFAEHVVISLESFQDLNHLEVVQKLIEIGKIEVLAKRLILFKGLGKDIAIHLIEANFAQSVVNHFENFQGLDQEIALKLIDFGEGEKVVGNLNKFENLDHIEIILKLIECGQSHIAEDNFDTFENLDKVKIISFADKYKLALSEAFYCLYKPEGIDEGGQKRVQEPENGQGIYEKLKSGHSEWQDQENIIAPFESGAAVFGFEKMFKYLGRDNLSRHDGLHNFKKIVRLLEASGLSPAEFYSNILGQVIKDKAEYYSGNAHHHLNSLADQVDLDFQKVFAALKQYSGVEKLQALAAELDDPKKIFASWKNLKKYQEICELLGRSEILDNLQRLKAEGKKELYSYIETLAFHPNISMEQVMTFWQDPNSFLHNDDSHTPEEVHDRKKPSNYTNIPNLDLTAEQLRDGLVEGAYDRLQVFAPFEIKYQVAFDELLDLRIDLARQIGVRDKELRKKLGIDENEKLTVNTKLFDRLNKIFKIRKLDLKKYLAGEIEIGKELESELAQFATKQETQEYLIKINRKSDPDGVVAGNDTACCMPFGSGKNNIYTFNPICSLLTVQRKNADGTFRTVAQSVLTLDKDIKENIANLREKMSSTEAKLHEVVGEDVLIEKPSIITCDNVELAENYKSQDRAGEILEELYRDFFQEYLKQAAIGRVYDQDRIVIGQGYSDSLVHLPTINNTFVPEAPVGYSDNMHPEAYLLDLRAKQKTRFIAEKKVGNIGKRVSGEEIGYKLPTGVSYLTFRDSLPVAYIEGKAYRSNESLIQYLHNMENALIAKDVNNEVKGRSNMSFKYQGQDGRVHGYMLAYEGERNVGENGYDEEDDKETSIYTGSEKVLYVSDLASDGNKRAGGSLLIAFIDAYKVNYLMKDNPVPILMQLRESTSYPIVKKNLNKLGEGTEYLFSMEEIGSYQRGEDTMHEVIIRGEKK